MFIKTEKTEKEEKSRGGTFSSFWKDEIQNSRCSHRNSANLMTGSSVTTDISEVEPTSSAAQPGEILCSSPNIVMTAAVGIAAITQPKTTM